MKRSLNHFSLVKQNLSVPYHWKFIQNSEIEHLLKPKRDILKSESVLSEKKTRKRPKRKSRSPFEGVFVAIVAILIFGAMAYLFAPEKDVTSEVSQNPIELPLEVQENAN